MRAAFLTADGVPIVRDVDPPVAGAGEAVIRIEQIALHHGNLLGSGERPLGSEAIGVIDSVGEGVALQAGTRVAVFPAWGAARELIALPASHIFPIAAELQSEAAAQLFVNPVTAQMVLRAIENAVSAVGQSGAVIVTGAASSLGRLIVAGVTARGLRVVAVTRRAGSAGRIAEEFDVPAIATETDGWRASLLEKVGPDGVLVVADGTGGLAVETYLELLPVHGSLILWGDLSGQPFSVTSSMFLPLERTVRGVSIMRWMLDETPETRASDAAHAQEFALGHPEFFAVADRFTLDELDLAIARVHASRGDGTVLVAVQP